MYTTAITVDKGGISGGTIQLMTPNRMRGQVMAVYLLVANLIGYFYEKNQDRSGQFAPKGCNRFEWAVQQALNEIVGTYGMAITISRISAVEGIGFWALPIGLLAAAGMSTMPALVVGAAR